MKITFLKHSGFLIKTDYYQLIFDFVEGTLPALDTKKQTVFFVSHRHGDHFSKRIYDYQNQASYVLSFDITDLPQNNFIVLEAHQKKNWRGLQIETLRSTDEGVAYVVSVEGKTIYHAGDLHLWLWEAENKQEEQENLQMQQRYTHEINRLKGRDLDVAFLVLDPRQEKEGVVGMQQFLSKIDVKHVFPMHQWKKFDFVDTFLKNELSPWEKNIYRIHHEQEEFSISL